MKVSNYDLYTGHTKCKAFLTHGGLNSLQEAVFHAVPVLGFPSGSDQAININRAVKEGYAVKLDWIDLTEETLFSSIELLVQNSSFVSFLAINKS